MIPLLIVGAALGAAALTGEVVPVDPSLVRQLIDIGLVGWLILSIFALVSGYVPTKGRLEDEKANRERYEAEIIRDRDEWKAIAKEAVHGLDRVSDLLERKQA